MQINRDYECGIQLRGLLFHVLYRWRSILIAAVIGAILMAGYQYLSVKRIHDEGKLTKEEQQYQTELKNYNDNREISLSKVEVSETNLQNLNTYKQESISMQMNSRRVWTANRSYLVVLDRSVMESLPSGISVDPADSILSAYSNPLSVADEQKLKEIFGAEKTQYVKELISTSIKIEQNMISTTVIGPEKETVQKGSEYLDELMKKISAGTAQEIEPHKLVLLSNDISIKANDQLNQSQNNLQKQIDDNLKALQTANKELRELKAPTKPGNRLVKKTLIGFLLGGFLLACLYTILYIFSNRMKDERIIPEKYDIPVYGFFPRSSSIHNRKGIDRLIAKSELKNYETDYRKAYDRIAVLIESGTKEKTILLISTLSDAELKPLQKELTERLPQCNIEAQGSILRNIEMLAEDQRSKAIIIAEKVNSSSMIEIDRMVETLLICRANVLGAVIL